MDGMDQDSSGQENSAALGRAQGSPRTAGTSQDVPVCWGRAVPLHTPKALPGKPSGDVAQLRKAQTQAQFGGAGVGATRKTGFWQEIRTVTAGSWEVMKGDRCHSEL